MQVSVVVPHLNANAFLATAVESALNQTLKPLEVIVVDDGSDRPPSHELRAFGENVRLIESRPMGVSAARNKGVAASRGALLAFLDADDRFAPTLLEKRSTMLAKQGVGAVVGNARMLDEDLESVLGQGRQLGCSSISFRSIYRQNLGGAGGSLFRRETLDRSGWFDPTLRTAEDWDLLLRVASRELVMYDDEPLLDIRIRKGSLSANAGSVFRDSLKVLSKAAAYSESPFQAWLDGRHARFVLTLDAWKRLGDRESRKHFLRAHPSVSGYLLFWMLRAAKNRVSQR